MDLTGNEGVGISESKQKNKVCPVDCGVCQHCVIWNISGFFVNEYTDSLCDLLSKGWL